MFRGRAGLRNFYPDGPLAAEFTAAAERITRKKGSRAREELSPE